VASAQSRQSFVCLRQWKCFRFGPYRDARRNLQKLVAIASSQIRDRTNRALTPQISIREGRDVAHVNASGNHDAAFIEMTQGEWHERADRCENDGGIHFFGWRFIGTAGPDSTKTFRKFLGLGIARASESENFASFKNRDLRDDVGGSAESVKAEAFGITAFAQSAKPDQARTQQWRGRDIVELIGKMKTKASVSDGEFRVTAVDGITGKTRARAKIFAAGAAKFAPAASPTQPRNADSIALAKCFYRAANLLDAANNFVAGNERQFWFRQFAIDDMKIGPANGTGRNAHQQLSGVGPPPGDIAQLQRLVGRIQDHRSHERNYVQREQERRSLFAMISVESGPAVIDRRYSKGERVKRRKACAEIKWLV
jgi:hypothetical protein